MAKSKVVEINTQNVIYYSQLDEAAFFGQLDKIPCVSGYTPVSFTVNIGKLNRLDLLNILACCYRYKIDMRQLKILDREEFSEWFRKKEMYWHKPVFGSPPSKKRRKNASG